MGGWICWTSSVPYTWVNKHIHLFTKLQGNMCQYALNNEGKIDHTPNIMIVCHYIEFKLSGVAPLC